MLSFFMSFLMFLEISTALLLIAVILMQRSRSGGGLGAIAGGATEEIFGSSAGSVLTKVTIVLSIFFLLNTLALAVLQGNAVRDRNISIVEQSEGETKGAPSAPAAVTEKPASEGLTGTNEVTAPTPEATPAK